MKKLIFYLCCIIVNLSYSANLEHKNNDHNNSNNTPLIPPSFFCFLLHNDEDNVYVNFADYYDHATDLLLKYIKVYPEISTELNSRKFIRAALIAVLISVKYAEEKQIYISDLLCMLNKLGFNFFSLEEMKKAEVNFLAAIKWKTAHPKEYLTFSGCT